MSAPRSASRPAPPGADRALRTLLFTGKGGVGKTTAAASTATLAAQRGLRTLVLSTDAAHSLADALDAPLGPEPTEVDTCLYAQQVDVRRRFEREWGEIQRYLLTVVRSAGLDQVTAEELTVLPGAEELLALLELRDQAASGDWDLVVVDCAPTAETLRLLALPEALGWYLDRLAGGRLARAVRPVLDRLGVPVPQDPALEALRRLYQRLAEVRALLTDATTSIRLVLTPESVVVAEARRCLTALALHGYRVDAVLANRVFPDVAGDAWLRGWIAAQAQQLEEIERCFAPLPVYRSPYRAAEPVGVEELAAFAAAAYGAGCRLPADPFGPGTARPVLSVERDGTDLVLCLDLPLVERGEIDLVRSGGGGDLVVTVGGDRRVLALPVSLRHRQVVGARLADGRLRVHFADAGPENQAGLLPDQPEPAERKVRTSS